MITISHDRIVVQIIIICMHGYDVYVHVGNICMHGYDVYVHVGNICGIYWMHTSCTLPFMVI